MYKQQASSIITRCADYSSPPPLWTDRRCPPSCSCMSPKGLSCQSSPALLSDYYSLSRRQPAVFLPPAWLLVAGCVLPLKNASYTGCPGLTTLIRVTRFVKPCHWGKKPLVCSLKFFLLCIIQTSLMVESNCQILWKQVPSSRSGIYMNLKYISYCAHHLILHSLIG